MASELPTVDRLYSIRKDGSHQALHPADVHGPWARRRRALFALLLLIYVGVPLIPIGGHPAVHLDVPGRRFFLFGATFNAQDAWIGIFLLAAFSFGLLFVTAWLGRAWCGFACPQTVLLEGLFRPIERLFDGPGEKRLRLATAPWTAGRVARAIGKHATYLLLAAGLAHVALGFFVSPRTVFELVLHGPADHVGLFIAMLLVTGLVYFNFMWFREQLCLIICPYGRLQSTLIDADSVILGYDRKRGEPRGKKADPGRGACVDCRRCIAVCPTGIDIRNGLQMECIGCTQCIDACDEIMDKVEQPRGLIRFDSQHGFAGAPRRLLRPRLVAMGALLLASIGALVVTLFVRQPFEANLLRQQGAPYKLSIDTVTNSFEIHLINKHAIATTFTIEPQLPPGATIVLPQREVTLPPLGSIRLPVVVTVARDRFDAKAGATVSFGVVESSAGVSKRLTAKLLGPARP